MAESEAASSPPDPKEDDVIDYAKKLRKVERHELNRQGLIEARRIVCNDKDDVEGIWTYHPASLRTQKDRRLHYLALLLLVHPDKHGQVDEETKNLLTDATQSKFPK